MLGTWNHSGEERFTGDMLKDSQGDSLQLTCYTKAKYSGPKLDHCKLQPLASNYSRSYISDAEWQSIDEMGLCRTVMSSNHHHAESFHVQVHCGGMSKSIEANKVRKK